MDLSTLEFQTLSTDINLGNFDSGDIPINEFLQNYAIDYSEKRIANTYLFLDNNEVAAYFCISNNCLKDLGEEKGYDRKMWKKFHKQNKIPFQKRIKQYPAILIGRIGVDKKYQGTGIAYEIMDFIKGWVLSDHKPACRFLILDAYNKEKQIKYYNRNGFIFLLEEDKLEPTRTMYFDMTILG